MPLEDKKLRRTCEREIAKFALDTSKLNIRALNHIIYLEGRIRVLRGAAGTTGMSLDRTLESVQEVLLAVPTVREVVMSQLQRDY
jgi:hypothetical protein